eukprot:gene19294-biopygen28237
MRGQIEAHTVRRGAKEVRGGVGSAPRAAATPARGAAVGDVDAHHRGADAWCHSPSRIHQFMKQRRTSGSHPATAGGDRRWSNRACKVRPNRDAPASCWIREESSNGAARRGAERNPCRGAAAWWRPTAGGALTTGCREPAGRRCEFVGRRRELAGRCCASVGRGHAFVGWSRAYVGRSRAPVALGVALACLVLWQVSYLGIRVGEARHPGYWEISTANVSSLAPTQLEATLSLGGEVIGVQETALTGIAQRDLNSQLRRRGWRAIWGKEQPPWVSEGHQATPWKGQKGGVGVLVRDHIPAVRGPVDTPVRKRLWETGRWVHAVVPYGDGRQTLHVMSVYGVSGAHRSDAIYRGKEYVKNEDLLSDVLLAAAELGNVPVLIIGDLNVETQESDVLREALATGRWEDAAALWAEMLGHEPEWTCETARREGEASSRSRIDLLLANNTALNAMRTVAVRRGVGLETHAPVTMELDVDTFGQRAAQLNQPRAFPVEHWEKWPEERMLEAADAAVGKVATSWREALAAADVEHLWRLFNTAAEQYLAERSAGLPGFPRGADAEGPRRVPRRHAGR